jgi:hypothetical protein
VVCDKCKEQVVVISSLKFTVCGCGEKKASKELLEYIDERNA